MKYFSMSEITRSAKATQTGIPNNPNAEERQHIVEMVEQCLDPLREAWGSGIVVTSGFRSLAINLLNGGSSTSAHTQGYAVDCHPANGRMKEFKAFCIDWFKAHPYDQLISEYEDRRTGIPSWIHIGYKHVTKGQRKQNLKTYDGKKYYKL